MTVAISSKLTDCTDTIGLARRDKPGQVIAILRDERGSARTFSSAQAAAEMAVPFVAANQPSETRFGICRTPR